MVYLVNSFCQFIFWLNFYQGLAQWLIFITGIIALMIAYKEFVLKKRPYIDFEIQISKNPNSHDGGWLFFALIINNGTYPGVARVKRTLMKVGDEEYPDEVKSEMIISPGKSVKSALIGSIYNLGIERIKHNQYRNNRVEFEIAVESKSLGSKKMQYITEARYEVNVRGRKPIIILISEKIV